MSGSFKLQLGVLANPSVWKDMAQFFSVMNSITINWLLHTFTMDWKKNPNLICFTIIRHLPFLNHSQYMLYFIYIYFIYFTFCGAQKYLGNSLTSSLMLVLVTPKQMKQIKRLEFTGAISTKPKEMWMQVKAFIRLK